MQEFQGSSDEIRPRIDSPALSEALEYWDSLCKERALPSRADFDPMKIAWILPSVLLLDVLPEDKFVYRLAGGEIEHRYQVVSFVGKTPYDTLGAEADKVMRPYRSVRDSKSLFYRDAEEDWLRREPSFKGYKVLLLPFSEDDITVTAILGVFDFLRG